MADITFSIPNGAETTLALDAIAIGHGYNASIHGTKAQFAKSVMIRLFREEVRRVRARLAADAAIATETAAVDALNIT